MVTLLIRTISLSSLMIPLESAGSKVMVAKAGWTAVKWQHRAATSRSRDFDFTVPLAVGSPS